MASHHPANFGSHRRCGSGDMMFLVVEGQDSTFSWLNPKYFLSLKHMACHALTHKIIGPRHLPVYQMKTHPI